MKRASTKDSKKKGQGPGRPRETDKHSSQIKGIMNEPSKISTEEEVENGTVIVECFNQSPLYFKCISNTIRQIEKSSNIEFCMTPDKLYIWEGEQENGKCLMIVNCDKFQQYYFNPQYSQQGFVIFDIPILHIFGTFNSYNRSSLRTEIRVFGPNKPVVKIDSYKSEKKNVQCITNIVNIQIEPSDDKLLAVERYLQSIDQVRAEPLMKLDKFQRFQQVVNSKTMFSECFFSNYKDRKVYSFTLLNSDIRKFVTEVQKECQKIQIRRDMSKDSPSQMRNIVLECRLPGSGSIKQLNTRKNALHEYKQHKQVDVEKVYEIGSSILKQITSNNPQSHLQFIMLDNSKVIVKIKDQLATYKFEISGQW